MRRAAGLQEALVHREDRAVVRPGPAEHDVDERLCQQGRVVDAVGQPVDDRLRRGQPAVDEGGQRGADEVVDFRAMSRVLAGFDDGRADEGPSAGDATLVGLRLARKQGWAAPAVPARTGRQGNDSSNDTSSESTDTTSPGST